MVLKNQDNFCCFLKYCVTSSGVFDWKWEKFLSRSGIFRSFSSRYDFSCLKITTNDIIVNIKIAGYLDCIYTRGFPFIFFLIKKRSKKIKLKIGNCCAPFTIGFTCVVLAHRTSNPSFIIADFQRTIQTLIYKHRTNNEIYTIRSKKMSFTFQRKFFPMARIDDSLGFWYIFVNSSNIE